LLQPPRPAVASAAVLASGVNADAAARLIDADIS
jgi:hypothetical protein